DERDPRGGPALGEDGLTRVPVELAAVAVRRRLAQTAQPGPRRDELRRARPLDCLGHAPSMSSARTTPPTRSARGTTPRARPRRDARPPAPATCRARLPAP